MTFFPKTIVAEKQDMANLPQGLYLLRVCTDEGVKVNKVVKR